MKMLIYDFLGVFVDPINYLLVIGTSAEVIAGCISAMPNHTGRYELTMYESRMAVNTKGLDVSVIEGSPKTGRIFFGGRSDNDIYEFTYQVIYLYYLSGISYKATHTDCLFSG